MSSLSISSGYSNKYKSGIKEKNKVNSLKSPGSPLFTSKLPPLSPNEFRVKRTEIVEYNRNQFSVPRSSLDRIIEDNNREFESAICEHLNLKIKRDINGEEIEEEHSPLVKINAKTPNRFKCKYLSKSVNDHYSNLDQLLEAEKILEDSIRNPRQVKNKDIFFKPKAKQKKLPISLEETRMLLKKLKK